VSRISISKPENFSIEELRIILCLKNNFNNPTILFPIFVPNHLVQAMLEAVWS
jgi:hypothetical protein